MSAQGKLQKKINNVQEKLRDNSNKVIGLFNEYQNIFSREYDAYISKIKKKCEKRLNYLSKVKDENKRTFFQESNDTLEKLMKENDNLVNNLHNSLKALKSFLLKDPNIFEDENNLSEKNEEKKNKLNIRSTDDCGKYKNILTSLTGKNLEILEINRITQNDFNHLFGSIMKKNEDNDNDKEIEEIKLRKLKFKQSILTDINFGECFPFLENLNISYCKIGYEISSKLNFTNIIRLSLEGIELVNENFEDLLIYLLNSQSGSSDFIGKNLKYLSVKNNRISRILFPEEIEGRKDVNNDFSNLKFLNLSENNLFDYYMLPKHKVKELFPSVEILDLTKNNITSPLVIKNLIDTKGKKCLILAAKNIGVIKNKQMRKKYCEYLVNKIQNQEYKESTEKNQIKSLVFEGLFGKDQKNKELLLNLDLNHLSYCLVELNFSFNCINDDEIVTILENNKNLTNLKRLILASNNISQNFFEKFVENKYYENHKKLKLLDLSCNPISFETANIYKNFISNCQNLESLILKNTLIAEDINHYMKNKMLRLSAEKCGKDFGKPGEKEREMDSLIDNNRYLKNNSKVYLTINQIVKPKYLKMIKKFYPYLLERIRIENETLY